MQERDSALAICMRFAVQPGQVPAQLVIQAFNVVRMCFANSVLLVVNDGFVGSVRISAVMDMFVRR